MPLSPPPPQMLDRPGTIRWAVGSPEGPRSQTWNVVGHEKKNDVFVGLRDRMANIKLSLHPAKWRLAYTRQAGPEYVEEGQDRLIARFDKPDELSPGWRHGCTIVITNSNLGLGPFQEKKVKRGEVAFFPAPDDPFGLRFDLYLGQPDATGSLTFNDSVGTVGMMTLRSGLRVGIVAHEVPVNDVYEAGLKQLRESASTGLSAEDGARGWAFGPSQDDGAPVVIDLSNLGPA